MLERAVTCDSCGQPAELYFGEGGMGWWESFHCPSCGCSYEADGGPPTPDEYRRSILREQGEWALVAPNPATTELLKVLRAVLSISLKDIQELRDRLPGQISRGTRYEMNRLLEAVRGHMPESELIVRPLVAPQR